MRQMLHLQFREISGEISLKIPMASDSFFTVFPNHSMIFI